MAIYHFSAQIITRSKGQSAVASASYRSGDKLLDERTGETKFYKREVQPETMILAPSHAPEWAKDRNRLWNEVEKIERNKNSQLAREINVALPNELSPENQKELIQNYVQEQFVDRGMVADIAIHRDDKNNQHAHVMLTVRQFDENGEWGNKKRKDYEFDKDGNKVLDKNGKPKYQTVSLTDWDKKENIEQWREQWAKHTNKALEKEGIQERITHLSHEARGLEQLPTIHLGHAAHGIEKRGEESDRGNINREVQEHNRKVIDLAEYRKEKEAIQKRQAQEKKIEVPVRKSADFLSAAEKVAIQKAVPVVKGFVTLDKIQERRLQLNQWEKKIQNSRASLDSSSKDFAKARGHFNRQQFLVPKIEEHQEQIHNINWLNPLKIKENRLTKELAEQAIAAYQKDFDYHEEQLDYFRKKLNFTDKTEFSVKETTFQTEKEVKIASHFKAETKITEEREVLHTAEKALKQSVIREVASHYPELETAGEYLSYETALKLKDVNEKTGKIVPINEIKSSLEQRQRMINERETTVAGFDKAVTNVNIADNHFKKLSEIEEKIEQIEKSPIAKAKLMFSKEAKAEHEKHLQQRDYHRAAIEKIGYKDSAHLAQHKELLAGKTQVRDRFEKEAQNLNSGNYGGGNNVGSGLLEAVLQGVEQAQQQEQNQTRAQERKRQKQHQKGQKTFDMER